MSPLFFFLLAIILGVLGYLADIYSSSWLSDGAKDFILYTIALLLTAGLFLSYVNGEL